MSDLEASEQLRNLSDDYSNNRVSFFDYRLQRQAILRSLDEECNQVYFNADSEDSYEDMNITDEVIDADEIVDEAVLAQELEQ
ncbi:hypothetical protein MNBD_GAMMA23-2130 [hydrothermal vent metagenome]|uniref:Uncharacterized protein n=1 Tax=hydrothermal vent metagenome TaxID=652676 RepID=A0A3B1ABA3_9ZZZZ